MKFQLAAVSALAMASSTLAFAPAPVAMRPINNNVMSLEMANGSNDLGKQAMSIIAAGVLAVSTLNTVLPVESAMAAATQQKAPTPEQVAVDLKKLPAEERNKIMAKKNYDLAQATLKEYSKIEIETKATAAKASDAFKNEQKVVEAAKKAVITDSDKLAVAKNKSMPASTIKELTAIASKSKETLKVEEKKLADLARADSKATQDYKNAVRSVEQSKNAVTKGKKEVEKTENEYKKYQKRVQEQKKKEAEKEKKAKEAAAKALAAEQKKLRELEAEEKRLEDIKAKSAKEIEVKKKAIAVEKQNLEKLVKTANK